MKANNHQLSDVLHKAPVIPPASNSSQQNVGTNERLVSAVAGAALTYFGFKKSSPAGFLLSMVGGALLWRGASGYCPINKALGRDTAHRQTPEVEIIQSLTINKPRQEVYRYWRQLENLPRFMHYLEDVRPLGPIRSQWVARLPKGLGTVEWEADIVQEEENALIAWRSVPGSDIDNAGEVRFTEAPANRGTIVQAAIAYRPPAGDVGGMAAKFLNPALKAVVKQDIRRFKRLLETGEIPTIIGQPSGRKNEIY